jgi:hypothetical protein
MSNARKKFSDFKNKTHKQAWNPNTYSAAIFKVYNAQGQYKCTGTLVGGYLYVVLHALSGDKQAKYKAVNRENNLILNAEEGIIVNSEIFAFPVKNINCILKNKVFKVLDTADIVTIYGYGSGQAETPDIIVGFASPKGWCNAQTRNGDCTAPVLTSDGKIVGFWTHGNGIDFGRFEPVTTEMIEQVKTYNNNYLSCLDFQCCPSPMKK